MIDYRKFFLDLDTYEKQAEIDRQKKKLVELFEQIKKQQVLINELTILKRIIDKHAQEGSADGY